MKPEPSGNTETVVRRHLSAFVEQRGLEAILSDYADDACFLGEAQAWRGRAAIGSFFEAFLAALPPGAVEQFALRTLRVDGEVAFITWSAGAALPLGTDTFVVRDSRIVHQTFAMHAAPSNQPSA
jgi:uncharacterized protein (TIGR02246 family)